MGEGHGRLGGSHKTPPKVRMGATSVSGRLPPEVIQRIVRQNFGRFRLCYENGLKTSPTLAGMVTVAFVIGRDGKVSSVADNKSDLPDAATVDCAGENEPGTTVNVGAAVERLLPLTVPLTERDVPAVTPVSVAVYVPLLLSVTAPMPPVLVPEPLSAKVTVAPPVVRFVPDASFA